MKYICSKVIEGKCNYKDGCDHYKEHSYTGIACDGGRCGFHEDEINCNVPCVPVLDFIEKKEMEI